MLGNAVCPEGHVVFLPAPAVVYSGRVAWANNFKIASLSASDSSLILVVKPSLTNNDYAHSPGVRTTRWDNGGLFLRVCSQRAFGSNRKRSQQGNL